LTSNIKAALGTTFFDALFQGHNLSWTCPLWQNAALVDSNLDHTRDIAFGSQRAVEHGLGEVQFALSFAEGMKAYLVGDYKGASKHFSEPKIVQNRAQYMLVLLRNQSEAGAKHDAFALAW
jgi:hypothetical protein